MSDPRPADGPAAIPPRRQRRLVAAVVVLGTLGTLTAGGSAAPAAPSAAPPATPPAPPAAPAAPPGTDTTATLPTERLALHVASFDQVWRTVREKHWDPEKVGAAWDAARDELRPRVLAAETDAEARVVTQKLLDTLGQSHFAVIPADAYDRMGEEGASAATPNPDADADADDPPTPEASDPDDGWHGLTIRLVEEQLLVTHVAAGSPGEAAGVRPGWIPETIGGRPAARLVEVARELDGLQRFEIIAASLAMSRLSGPIGSTVSATFIDGDDASVPVAIDLVASPAPTATLGNLPPMPVEIESRTLPSGVGYFRLGAFFGPDRVMPAWRTFLATHADAPGIVLDLRGNPGGIIMMSTGLLNFLVEERGNRLGTMHMRDDVRGPFELPIMINPRATTYGGSVAVLVDEMSMSNSEILAAGLQDLGRAHVIGGRTAGLVLPSTVERLPNGDGFLHAFAGYDRSNGEPLEGAGVTPDVVVVPHRAALLGGVDPALATADEIVTGRWTDPERLIGTAFDLPF